MFSRLIQSESRKPFCSQQTKSLHFKAKSDWVCLIIKTYFYIPPSPLICNFACMEGNTNRYFIKLAYNGTKYHGWQIQDNAPTIQAVFNQALKHLVGEEVNVIGCGRTDTGVHARQFYAHFNLKNPISSELNELQRKLNSYLPFDIRVFDLFEVKPDFHARFDAISRTYKYYITRAKDPFNHEFAWFVYGDLNMNLMNKGAQVLLDYSDFTSFSKTGTQVKTNNCKIVEAFWEENNETLIFTITADRFLRNMVRAIVGTLVELGKEKITIENFKTIIESKNRSNAGLSVPAKGLFLYKVKYQF